jgi:hypothetical protein
MVVIIGLRSLSWSWSQVTRHWQRTSFATGAGDGGATGPVRGAAGVAQHSAVAQPELAAAAAVTLTWKPPVDKRPQRPQRRCSRAEPATAGASAGRRRLRKMLRVAVPGAADRELRLGPLVIASRRLGSSELSQCQYWLPDAADGSVRMETGDLPQ